MAVKLATTETDPSLLLGEFQKKDGVLYVGTTDFGLYIDGGSDNPYDNTPCGSGLCTLSVRFIVPNVISSDIAIPSKQLSVTHSFTVPEPEPEPEPSADEGLLITSPPVTMSGKEVNA